MIVIVSVIFAVLFMMFIVAVVDDKLAQEECGEEGEDVRLNEGDQEFEEVDGDGAGQRDQGHAVADAEFPLGELNEKAQQRGDDDVPAGHVGE